MYNQSPFILTLTCNMHCGFILTGSCLVTLNIQTASTVHIWTQNRWLFIISSALLHQTVSHSWNKLKLKVLLFVNINGFHCPLFSSIIALCVIICYFTQVYFYLFIFFKLKDRCTVVVARPLLAVFDWFTTSGSALFFQRLDRI